MRVNILVKYTPCICLLLYISRIRLLAFSICLTSSLPSSLFLPLCQLLLLSSSASYAASVDCVSTFCLTFNSFHFCGSHCTSDSSSPLPPSLHPFCSSFKIIFTCCPLLCCCCCCACVQQGVARVFCGYFYCISFLCTYNDNFSSFSAVLVFVLVALLHACRGMKSVL